MWPGAKDTSQRSKFIDINKTWQLQPGYPKMMKSKSWSCISKVMDLYLLDLLSLLSHQEAQEGCFQSCSPSARLMPLFKCYFGWQLALGFLPIPFLSPSACTNNTCAESYVNAQDVCLHCKVIKVWRCCSELKEVETTQSIYRERRGTEGTSEGETG